jgi:membrane protein involved in colicin uptake
MSMVCSACEVIPEFPDQMTTDSAAVLQAKQFIQQQNQEAKRPENQKANHSDSRNQVASV